MAIVQSKRGEAGTIAVTVTSEGLEAATVAVTASAGSMIPIVE
jgi:hypothetical protein